MLSLAGGNPRDYAILQVFLQTGVRVSELAHLRLEDVDLIKPAITVRGKAAIPAARFKILYDPISSSFQYPVARL
jgi:integrase